MTEILQPPALDHDAMMAKRFGCHVRPEGKLERRIVWNLCAHMARAGWMPHSVYDGESNESVTDAKSAMELIFNLDEACLFFSKGKARHNVYLVLGNGVDILSDWNYAKGDADGFNATVNAFEAEQFA